MKTVNTPKLINRLKVFVNESAGIIANPPIGGGAFPIISTENATIKPTRRLTKKLNKKVKPARTRCSSGC